MLPLSRRAAIGGIAGSALLPATASFGQRKRLTAREVFAEIKRASGQYWNPNPTDDRIIYGDHDAPITGIATCFFSSLDVLRRAKAAGLNYIIPHEASFYERYDDLAEFVLPDDDPVITGKKRFIDANRMVIQRMHGHAHSRPGDAITVGLLRQLGWDKYRVPDRNGRPIVKLPTASASEIGRSIKEKMGRRTLRMFGDPNRQISTISVSAGMPGENVQISQMTSDVDAVYLGEVREPEVLGYAQDLAASRPITVYLVGHTNEDPGMGVVAEWLKTVFPTLPVRWLPLVDPYSNPV
ncbi:MAG: Nif3-like dinuclear metal center hexameric protein [Sphingomicrobium sp.]